MSNVNPFSLSAVSVIALLALPFTASASLIISAGNTPGGNNVLFNQVGLIDNANTIQGVLPDGVIVNFTGTESLSSPSGGQARVAANDGSYIDLSLTVPGHSFTQLVWNLNTFDRTPGTVQFTLNGNQVGGAFNLGVGQNFFTILATGGSVLTSASFHTTGVELLDTRQVRIGGVSQPDSNVPEPGTFISAGLALSALGFYRRRAAKS